jgi:hypothetical protein
MADSSAKMLYDYLMAQADAEYRELVSKVTNCFQ